MIDYGNWTTKAKHHRGHSTLPHVGASLLDFCAHQLVLSEETMGQMIQLNGEYQKSTWRGLCCWKRNKWAPQSAIFMGSSFQMSFPARARIIPNFPKNLLLTAILSCFGMPTLEIKYCEIDLLKLRCVNQGLTCLFILNSRLSQKWRSWRISYWKSWLYFSFSS